MTSTEQERRDEVKRMTLEYLEMGYTYPEARAEAEREWRKMFGKGDEGAGESEPPHPYIVRRMSAGDSGVVVWTPRW